MIGPQGSVIVNQDGNINWSQVAEAWKNGGIRVRPTGGSAGTSGDHIAVDNKYKTSMCKYKTNHGYCKNGDSCIFAHSSSELRAKNFGGNGSKMIEGGPLDMAKKEIIKTAMCKYQANYGNCKNGDSCIFAHSSSELRPKNFGGNGNTMIEGGSLNMAKNNNKTAMCKYQTNYGNCKNGDSCIFAHSSSELTPKSFGGNGNMIMEGGPVKKKRGNTKTVLCQNYSNYGKCKFGENCTYAHGSGELRNLP